jgi:hypothetical protein
MEFFERDSFSEAELAEEFDRLFPQGFAGADVVQELAPGGWENSPLLAVFHPSLEQRYTEAVRMHCNIQSLWKPDASRPVPPEPTRDDLSPVYKMIFRRLRARRLDWVYQFPRIYLVSAMAGLMTAPPGLTARSPRRQRLGGAARTSAWASRPCHTVATLPLPLLPLLGERGGVSGTSTL